MMKLKTVLTIIALIATFVVPLSSLPAYAEAIQADTQISVNTSESSLRVIGSHENFKKLLPVSALCQPTPTPTCAPIVSPSPVKAELHSYDTNMNVQKIDEPDTIKTDGEYIYKVNNKKLSVIKAYPADEVSIINSIEYTNISFSPRDIYVEENMLILIGVINKASYSYDDSQYYTNIIIIDITDKTNIVKLREIELRGYYASSKKIGSHIYFATSTQIKIITPEEYYNNSPKLRPSYRDTVIGNTEILIDFDSIYYFPDTIQPNYLLVGSINPSLHDQGINVKAYLSGGRFSYASESVLYIAHPNYITVSQPDNSPYPTPSPGYSSPLIRNWNKTLLHKFSIISGTPVLEAKADITGSIFYPDHMDAYNGYLRIVTDSRNLYIMDSDLNIAGSLENIGVNGSLGSARFLGHKAVVSTNSQNDSLFVIDLSEVNNPRVLGALGIRGYSYYMLPYDQNHIIGLGYSTDSYGSSIGYRISLIDISDPTNPDEKFVEEIEGKGTFSEFFYDHKGLLFDKNLGILAIPIREADTRYIPYKHTYQGAYIYNLDPVNGFNLKGKVSHIPDVLLPLSTVTRFGYRNLTENYISRIMYINNAFYTFSDNKIEAIKPVDLTELSSISILGKDAYVIGDANTDGRVDSTDLTLMKRCILKIPLSPTCNVNALDINGDGVINSIDYNLMKRCLLGIITLL